MSDGGAGFAFGLVIGVCLTAMFFMVWLGAKVDQCANSNKTPCHIMAVVKEAK